MLRLPLRLGLFLAVALAATAAVRAQSAPRDTRDGVYSTEQAERGRVAYEQYCVRCHRADLGGQNGPPLAGTRFLDRWREFKLEVLFDTVRATMPPRRGGVRPAVPDDAFIDIIAFVLQRNELPPGAAEMAYTDLAAITLLGLEGSRPLPSSSLVELVACFGRLGDGTWGLTSASRPARTVSTDISPVDRDLIDSVQLGETTFHLQSLEAVPDVDPQDYMNTRVHVKGYLILQPNRERINLTALEVIGYAGCR